MAIWKGRPATWALILITLISLPIACAAPGTITAPTSTPAANGKWETGLLTVQGRDTYRYRLLIPLHWAGRYRIQEEGNSVSFIYSLPPDVRGKLQTVTPASTPPFAPSMKPKPEERLFSILLLTDEQWSRSKQELGATGRLLATLDGVVVISRTALSNPYSAPGAELFEQLAADFQRMSGEVPGILKSLEVSPT